MIVTNTPQHPTRLLLTLAAVACLGLACATVDNNAIAAQQPAGKAAPVATNVPVYYWYDGDKKREIVIASGKVADFSTRAVIVDAAVATKSSTGGANTSAVFVDANSGRMSRALPGGVLVRFRAVTSQSEANVLLKPFGTRIVRAIGASGKSWLVQSEPGMASLDLANAIYESGQFQSASPNWFKQRATK